MLNKKYAGGGFAFFLTLLFGFLILINGGFLLIPFIIIISLPLGTYLVFFYKNEGDSETGIKTETGYVNFGKNYKKDAAIGCAFTWVIGIIVIVWFFY